MDMPDKIKICRQEISKGEHLFMFDIDGSLKTTEYLQCELHYARVKELHEANAVMVERYRSEKHKRIELERKLNKLIDKL